MTPVEASGARELLEAAVAAFSILGGGMAYTSGFLAAQALAERQPPHVVAQRVNEGVGFGRAYDCRVELMERATSIPWGVLASSTAVAAATSIAIFGLGAPPWILVPVTWGGALLFAATYSRFHRAGGRNQ